MSELPQCEQRRNWLLGVLGAGVTATMGAVFYPIVRFLWPREVTQSGALSMVAPYRVSQLRPDGDGVWPSPFDFAGKPCLVILTQDGAKRAAASKELQKGDVKAFNAICTHTDCTVQYRPEKGDIFCSCHNGVYDTGGNNVSGPPPRPLKSYDVAVRGDDIIISRS